MKLILCMPWFMLLWYTSKSQTIKGMVFNNKNNPIQGVSIILKHQNSKILAYGITRDDGSFSIGGIHDSLQIVIIDFRHISYDLVTRRLEKQNGNWALANVELKERSTELKEVIIKRELPVRIQSDTIVFNANSFRDSETRKVEDLLKKMQGFTVDANGRLSFNGKPVEKVLIEGDDLANNAYQMITKNLNANLIDKIEVIENFSGNRLLRQAAESGKVGVNLRINQKSKSRLSGGVEASAAIERRYNADINAILVKPKSKWLVFGSYNNTANDPAGNAKYYFEQEGIQTENSSDLPLVLESGKINMPIIGERYTNDNNDLAVSMLNTWKIGKTVKLRGMLGYSDLGLRNFAEASTSTIVGDQDRWILNSALASIISWRDLVGSFSVLVDEGKNHLSNIEMELGGGKQKNEFINLTSGDITDSLLEKLTNGKKGFRFKWEESFLARNRVVRIKLNYSTGETEQILGIRTARYASYWNLDSSFLFNNQNLKYYNRHLGLSLHVNGKTETLQFEYGLELGSHDQQYNSDALIRSIDLKPDYINSDSRSSRNQAVKGLFRISSIVGKKGRLGVSGEGGFRSLNIRDTKKDLLVFKSGLAYVRSYSMLNSFRLNYSMARGFNLFSKFYPDELMSGNGSILNGLSFNDTEIVHGFMASLNSNNISKQRRWSASLSYNIKPRQYIPSIDMFPAYSVEFWEYMGNYYSLNSGFSWEAYWSAVKGKFGAQANIHASRYEQVVNQVKGKSGMSGIYTEAWWVSAFMTPINLELKGFFNYTAGAWTNGGSNHISQYKGSIKLKYKPGKSFYSAVIWRIYQLARENVFHGLDLYTSYRFKSGLLISLIGNNLYNSGNVMDRIVTPFSNSTNRYQLVGRYFLVSLNMGF